VPTLRRQIARPSEWGRREAYIVVALVAALPRLLVLLVERGTILEEFVEKSDRFAQTFVASGTFGFVPGVPSANTQPLYAFFLSALFRTTRVQKAVRCCCALGPDQRSEIL
jgi:hypothetical protein